MPRRVLMDSMLVPSRLTQAFTEMAWRQLICDKDQFFLTSDHPLWFDERAGLAHERVDVTFPISSDAVLVLSRKPVSEGVFRAGRDIVAEVNHRSAAGSLRYMYGTRAEPWAAKL